MADLNKLYLDLKYKIVILYFYRPFILILFPILFSLFMKIYFFLSIRETLPILIITTTAVLIFTEYIARIILNIDINEDQKNFIKNYCAWMFSTSILIEIVMFFTQIKIPIEITILLLSFGLLSLVLHRSNSLRYGLLINILFILLIQFYVHNVFQILMILLVSSLIIMFGVVWAETNNELKYNSGDFKSYSSKQITLINSKKRYILNFRRKFEGISYHKENYYFINGKSVYDKYGKKCSLKRPLELFDRSRSLKEFDIAHTSKIFDSLSPKNPLFDGLRSRKRKMIEKELTSFKTNYLVDIFGTLIQLFIFNPTIQNYNCRFIYDHYEKIMPKNGIEDSKKLWGSDLDFNIVNTERQRDFYLINKTTKYFIELPNDESLKQLNNLLNSALRRYKNHLERLKYRLKEAKRVYKDESKLKSYRYESLYNTIYSEIKYFKKVKETIKSNNINSP